MNKSLNFVVALALMFVSSIANADKPAGIFFTDFCNHPDEAVCGPLITTEVGRVLRRAEIRGRVAQGALDHTIRTLHLAPRFVMTDLAKMTPWDRIRIPAVYFGKYNELLDLEISSAEKTALWGQIDNVKKYLNSAIDDQFRPIGETQSVTNTLLKAEINRTIIVDTAKLVEMAKAKSPDAAPLVGAFLEFCGEDGLGDNAFAAPVEQKDKSVNKYLVVCPGFLLGAIGSGRDASGNFSNMIKTLAHEWGHHIDSKWFPHIYKFYATCLADFASDGLLDISVPAEVISEKIPSPDARRNRAVQTHLHEITADFWGTQAIVQYFKTSLTAPIAFLDRLNFLREAHGVLCRTPDDGKHPSGTYRMDVLLRTDKQIAKLMGCKALQPGIKPTCTLSGLNIPTIYLNQK